jgi:hypothetical protein
MQIWMMVPAIHRRIKSLQAKMTCTQYCGSEAQLRPRSFALLRKTNFHAPVECNTTQQPDPQMHRA